MELSAGARARAGETAGDGMAASPGFMGVRGEPPPGRPVHSDRREETPFAAERVQRVAFGPPGSAPQAGEAPTGEAPPLPALNREPQAAAWSWAPREASGDTRASAPRGSAVCCFHKKRYPEIARRRRDHRPRPINPQLAID